MCIRDSSFNVSAQDLTGPYIANAIAGFIAEHEKLGGYLEIELTETAAVSNADRIIEQLEKLRSLGVRVLMDDFGKGYSSIDQLSQLPIDIIKLDQGVVKRMQDSPKNLIIVRAAISMARELRMEAVAEGIENEAAFNFLVSAGCTQGQGYWMAKPMPREDLCAMIGAGPRWRSSQLGQIYQAQLNTLFYRKCILDAAFCLLASPDAVMNAVKQPDISHDPEHSRFGKWYYGYGQYMADRSTFKEIKEPHTRLHQIGGDLMAAIQRGADDATMDPLIEQLTFHGKELDRLLRRLERELLLETNAAAAS